MDTTLAVIIIVALFAFVALAAFIRYGGPSSRNTTDINVWNKLRLRSQSANERAGSVTIKGSTARAGDATAVAAGDALIEDTEAGRHLRAEGGLRGEASDPKDPAP